MQSDGRGRSYLPRGGKRPGAGRKPGAEWTSKRPKTVRDLARANVSAALETGDDPVLILLGIAKDQDNDVQTRAQAAAWAAPYMHPKLSAMVVADASQKIEGRDPLALLGEITSRIERIARARLPMTGKTIDVETLAPLPAGVAPKAGGAE